MAGQREAFERGVGGCFRTACKRGGRVPPGHTDWKQMVEAAAPPRNADFCSGQHQICLSKGLEVFSCLCMVVMTAILSNIITLFCVCDVCAPLCVCDVCAPLCGILEYFLKFILFWRLSYSYVISPISCHFRSSPIYSPKASFFY